MRKMTESKTDMERLMLQFLQVLMDFTQKLAKIRTLLGLPLLQMSDLGASTYR